MTFMQDNALIHTARVVKQWFANMAIPLTDWPPYSPDLNPIKQVWFHMKLEKALIEAWDALPSLLFESLIDSMERRVNACWKAKGWHTKY